MSRGSALVGIHPFNVFVVSLLFELLRLSCAEPALKRIRCSSCCSDVQLAAERPEGWVWEFVHAAIPDGLRAAGLTPGATVPTALPAPHAGPVEAAGSGVHAW